MVAAERTSRHQELEARLLGAGKVPLADRFRALFELRHIGDDTAVDIIAKAFTDSSALLKHELAYVLGQMRKVSAIPHLTVVLENTDEAPMVRHEAAEALGAIGDPKSLPVLRKYLADPEKVVSQTCELAVANIEHTESKESEQPRYGSVYMSVDPAPALTKELPVSELRSKLLNPKLPLFERYRAMFSLRNKGDEEAIAALGAGFCDDSALFRHEIAYVFGQMQHPASVPYLLKVLANTTEEPIVRHEAAEALGSIGTEECLPALKKYRGDAEVDRVIQESCDVGVDMWEWENNIS
ncbi:deoxyhypusine hydroxylase [Gonapodya prolifera JEL478]|uniref:Deoxyhypusine hydroxylase n=1 Tax=Gonapodya prolifera (strain JEL478) TaxID=1344416 RepID=A0A138ZZ39_GONPJ|nr:deoxyhypusine hydroxylase [Gonapodya prolifera JEL478]|eukprot:KXS09760.1 deoxyhypusine hydroxylase [Gonapodya prolifera JEL478]